MLVNLYHFPKVRGENKQYLTHHLVNGGETKMLQNMGWTVNIIWYKQNLGPLLEVYLLVSYI